MAEKKKRKKVERQSWSLHWSLGIPLKLWKAAFAVVKIALGAAATVAIILGICAMVFAGSLGDYLEEDILAGANSESDYDLDLNSYIYYVDGNGEIQKLQNIYAQDNRDWVNYEDIPKDLINATVAIEDKRFFEHQGVDWVTTVKACFFMFFGNGDRGGSTITQQLVKNVTDNWSVTVQRKVQEIFTAIGYERKYDKTEILEWYLNEIYMGNRCNGVKKAAEIYFGKELEMLTVAECASLISITNNPSLYNPYRENLDKGGMTGAERNRERQLDTLDEMLAQEWITQEQYDEAVAQELVFKRGIDDEDRMTVCTNESCGYRHIARNFVKKEGEAARYCPKCGEQVIIRSDASQEVYSYFVDTVIEDVAMALAERDGVTMTAELMKSYKSLISRRGYHIYTTLDMDVQKQLDKIYTDLSQIPETRSGQQLQSAMVIIDNTTGDIVALTGGVGTDKVHDGLNRAVDSELQTGSSIKPLTVYAPAFETGAMSPVTVVRDMPNNYNPGYGWPKNDNRKYNYRKTIYSAIRSSINACAVDTLATIGTGYAYDFGKDKFGLTSLLDKYTTSSGEVKSDEGLAPLALGAQTLGLTVREMASAFGTFANKGVWREGRTFTKVYDNEGNLVIDNTQDSREILSNKTVNYINYCLGDAVLRGTGGEADLNGQNVYGKTGTTASNRDRWFCGFTGHYTAAVWTGYDQPEQIFVSGNPAAQLFRKVMNPIHAGLPRMYMVDKSGMRMVTVCVDTGLLATEACEADIRTAGTFTRTESHSIYPEDAPKRVCDKHVLVEYCTSGGGVATDYCKLFAQELKAEDAALENTILTNVKEIKIDKKALLKMTQAEIDELNKAKAHGLEPEYLRDDYIYLINKDGTDAVFKGVDGKLKQKADAPYQSCPVHTEEAWKDYQKQKESLKPVEPTDPETGEPTVPGTGEPAAPGTGDSTAPETGEPTVPGTEESKPGNGATIEPGEDVPAVG